MAGVDGFSDAVGTILSEYAAEVDKTVEEAVTITAKETVKVLRREAEDVLGGSGDYAKSWAQRKTPKASATSFFSRTIYSKPPFYRLAHLLEHGHAKVNGGRVPGRPHISTAEDYAEGRLRALLTRGIEED